MENEQGKVVYEQTSHSVIPLPDVTDTQPIIKEELFGERGFVLYNVLSPSECAYYIEQGRKLGLEPADSSTALRNCDRVVYHSVGLSELIFERIKPFIEPEITLTATDYKQVGTGPRLEGTWNLFNMNEMWRCCRYLPGGHFGPHRDGFFVRSSTERSMKTFMLYLNDGFEGGTTNFLDEKQMLHKDENGLFRAQDEFILNRLEPKPGMALVFNHQILHEGGQLVSGEKFILRSDLMYKRLNPPAFSAKEEKALLLYELAKDLESSHQCMEAAETYNRAFKLWPDLEKCMFS
eukprot:TRINITY_DN10656_c0_g1_i1.p1 TRINITY_DN10656_c0_g1~~TRINITY_DN10656_c0_g1_i1.p1  ORF type:complete len:292 (-),score=35.54 TRINITY_DN10656_c0_g1_i1:39-914(-)